MQSLTAATISPDELKSQLAHGRCRLVDVREPVEHAEEHIVGAHLIPLGEIEGRSHELPRDEPLILMCRSGKRGEQAVAKLEALGFTSIQNLEGGILAWKAAGHPVGRADRKVFPLMQQAQIIIGVGVLTGIILSRVVHPSLIGLSVIFGAGLVFAGATGRCGLAMLLSRMRWNRVDGQTSCASGACHS